MKSADLTDVLGPALVGALERKGITTLTAVQQAVLAPDLVGRDLRITSQTGSGKTVALGFVLRDLVQPSAAAAPARTARPSVIVVTPTRELARQVETELGWLYAQLRVRVVSVTGGASYVEERRALAVGPAVVVGTPGRLLDHLGRGAIDGTGVGAVVLDEADRMLDMGFREEVEGIFAHMPEERRTYLMSATFPHEVRSLADRVQRDAALVEGTRLGAANTDIDHFIHLVAPEETVDAVINLLLADPQDQTLVFARTRTDVAEIAKELQDAGFAAASLSGDLEQNARNRTMAAFKRGELRVLVATDVAARGIDVQDIARVIQAEPPNDPDNYVHRSGRTGRAGRRGTSSLIVAPARYSFAERLLRRAGVTFQVQTIPRPEEILDRNDERVVQELTVDDPDGFCGYDERTWALAKRLAASENVTRILARLLLRTRHNGPTEPREVRAFAPPTDRKKGSVVTRPRSGGKTREWESFRVTWGKLHGADPRRLLALLCRRGGIQGTDIGTIRVEPTYSVVEVRREVAESFASQAALPDPRDRRVRILRETPPERAKGAKKEVRRPGRSTQRQAAEPKRERTSRPKSATKGKEDGGNLPPRKGKKTHQPGRRRDG